MPVTEPLQDDAMGPRAPSHRFPLLLSLTGVLLSIACLLSVGRDSFAALSPVSLQEYQTKAVPVPNPMDLTKLPLGQVYQVNHPNFVLQFFFSGNHILGIIFKREPQYPLFVRWCFFRSCEDSPYDFTTFIASPHQPPFNEDFFQVRLPVRFNYKFQGLYFSTGLPNKPLR